MPIRFLLIVPLAIGELLVTTFLVDFDFPFRLWHHPAFYVRQLALLCVAAALAFVVTSWPRRHAVLAEWRARLQPGDWRLPLILNLSLFIVLTLATIEFSLYVATLDHPPRALYGVYLLPLGAIVLSLLWLAAPYEFWRALLRHYRPELTIAAVAGFVVIVAGTVTQVLWKNFAGATVMLSYRLLSLYEADVRVDYDTLQLGVLDFEVNVLQPCSGYEGIGLVTAFLGLFLWVFRRELLFPRALVLLPIGIGAIWLLNTARVAALVSLGAHVSPEVAVGGFHSQAGWIAFLLVTIGIMTVAPKLGVFDNRARQPGARATSDRMMLAFLTPFMGLMAASIVAAASAPYDTWLYGLRVVAVGVTLFAFRDIYFGLIAKVEPFAIVCGVMVGVLWIVSAPVLEHGSGVAAWIAAQPIWAAVVWLSFRAIGSIVMVPIAEELAFRGLLHRWLISRRFETVAFAQFSWFAFVVSSLLFGFMHQRWIVGAVAGAVFALVMYRSGRLSDAIAAHMAANAVILNWAFAVRNWALI
jgi:exosortase E/protease (VPEID-CTERM system)